MGDIEKVAPMSVAVISSVPAYDEPVARWAPGAQDRLRTAALELFLDQGFDETTTEEIAARAGVSERTFFRHFDDKREVLFTGGAELQRHLVDAVVAAPAGARPMAAVAGGLAVVAALFTDERRADARRRDRVITSHPSLRERELLKLSTLATAVAAALRERGVPEPAAGLAGNVGVTVFSLAFDAWVAEGETRTLAELQVGLLDELVALGPRPA